MTDPATLREALIAEAIGDVARMNQRLEVLAPLLDEKADRLNQAVRGLGDAVVSFDNRVAAISERAKLQTAQYMATRAEELTRKLVAQNSQAMADAARIAIGAELGATLHCWQAVMQPLIERAARPWETWLGYAAALSTGTLLGWLLAVATGHA